MKYLAGLVVAAGIVLLVLVLFPSRTHAPRDGALAPQESTSGGEVKQEAGQDIRVVSLTAKDFSFSQTFIDIKQGERVRIELSVEQGTHDWVLKEFNAKTEQVSAGGTTSVEFIADKMGEFEYLSSVGSDRAQGMFGTLIVR